MLSSLPFSARLPVFLPRYPQDFKIAESVSDVRYPGVVKGAFFLKKKKKEIQFSRSTIPWPHPELPVNCLIGLCFKITESCLGIGKGLVSLENSVLTILVNVKVLLPKKKNFVISK